ncbi:MAG: PP0621 family protein [Burkholderiaceae bacterium]
MKILIFLVAVVVLLWLLRGSSRRRAEPPRAAPPAALPMATCRHCGLNLPRDEALPGKGGEFCGEAHRAEYERTHPAP